MRSSRGSAIVIISFSFFVVMVDMRPSNNVKRQTRKSENSPNPKEKDGQQENDCRQGKLQLYQLKQSEI